MAWEQSSFLTMRIQESPLRTVYFFTSGPLGSSNCRMRRLPMRSFASLPTTPPCSTRGCNSSRACGRLPRSIRRRASARASGRRGQRE